MNVEEGKDLLHQLVAFELKHGPESYRGIRDETGIAPAMLSYIANFDRMPTLELLLKLAEHFDIPCRFEPSSANIGTSPFYRKMKREGKLEYLMSGASK